MITHLESCAAERGGRECDCTARWIARVRGDTTRLAETLKEASDAGVSHALILPQLVLVFRESFGEMPQGFTLPGVPA